MPKATTRHSLAWIRRGEAGRLLTRSKGGEGREAGGKRAGEGGREEAESRAYSITLRAPINQPACSCSLPGARGALIVMPEGDMAKPLLGRQNVESNASLIAATGNTTVGILGSGDFARSLSMRLVCSGFKVVIGSRNPKRNATLFPSAAEVTFQADAIKKTDIIFVAVFREHYTTLCDLSDELSGKILVDVSNNDEINHHKESNAEYLASLFPSCTVVKGFNVISAWTLQSGPRDGNKQVEKKTDPWVEEEVWRMEMYISFGIMALGLLSLLAITSLPSISNSLNWREFSFIQSSLGFVALVISTLHTLTYGWTRAFDESQYKFYLPPTFTLTLLVPCSVILAKLFFQLPCMNQRLRRIRNGWERGRYVKFTLPRASGEFSSGETSSTV
uniref:STEAP3 metalloreductase n=1 Tax=Podarcis muralis TaxID=64176 RepID=A0A670IDE6_PODMU